MRLPELLDICEAYAGLGSAVTEQMQDLVTNGPGDSGDFNENALALIIDFLADVRDTVSDATLAVDVVDAIEDAHLLIDFNEED